MGTLSLLLILPLLAMLLVLFLPSGKKGLFRQIVLGATLLQALVFFALILPAYFNEAPADYHLTEKVKWIFLNLGDWGHLNIEYHLALDGMSLILVMLTVIILPIAALSSWNIERRPKAYFALFLLLDLAMIGCFMALDFFLFYIFYELMLLPMFFLIGMWGGPRREYASIKFFLYTLFGSVFMLLIMVALAFSYVDPAETAVAMGKAVSTDLVTPEMIAEVQSSIHTILPPSQMVHTFDMTHMMEVQSGTFANLLPASVFGNGGLLLGLDARLLAFIVLFIGFAIKVPVVPLHTWLPDAHVEAPTPVSVLLAAVLLKVGGYGIIRICYGIFPDGGIHFSGLIAALGVVSIVYGAMLAIAQKDFKAMIAYSSISHMGFVLLGIAAFDQVGMNGAVFQMFNHGIISAALFLIAGVVYDRTHDRQIGHYSGLWGQMPKYSAVVLIAFFASMGLPGLNSFASEMMVFLGSFGSELIPKILPVIGVLGIVLAAVYYLRTYRIMFFGEYSYKGGEEGEEIEMKDLNRRELGMLVPLAVLMIVVGILPFLILGLMDESVSGFVEQAFEVGGNYYGLPEGVLKP